MSIDSLQIDGQLVVSDATDVVGLVPSQSDVLAGCIIADPDKPVLAQAPGQIPAGDPGSLACSHLLSTRIQPLQESGFHQGIGPLERGVVGTTAKAEQEEKEKEKGPRRVHGVDPLCSTTSEIPLAVRRFF
ncbi:MAG TPA: hypothetical protein VLX28_26830 [Thermoanaerobaculia bacterium]|nr:hypothetical protein [Thermoanaerobaculia bacterium]